MGNLEERRGYRTSLKVHRSAKANSIYIPLVRLSEAPMNRRAFLAIGSSVAFAEFPLPSAPSQIALESNQGSKPTAERHQVLVRAGVTLRPDGTQELTTSPQQIVVRSFDSDGRLAAFVISLAEHEAYRGAPLHLHHEQD